MYKNTFFKKENLSSFLIPLLVVLFFGFIFLEKNDKVVTKVNDLSFTDLVSHKVSAAGGYELEGWAWSDNIGWISFNCSNMGVCGSSDYKVLIDSSKELSGYAWSDNIGWISFNSSDLSGCPSGTCKAWMNNGDDLVGWAKALAGESESDGWDGWISLSCENTSDCSTASDYTITLNGGLLQGYAWGDEVVGWIDFSPSIGGVKILVPSVNTGVSVTKNDLLIGETTTVSWDSQNTNQCAGSCSGDSKCSFSPTNTSGSHMTAPISTTTNYFVRCFNSFGDSDSDSVEVRVLDPTLSITATDNPVRKGEGTYLSWSAQNVDSCVVTGPSFNKTGITKSNAPTGPIGSSSEYILTCVTSNTGINISESVTINVLPVWEEF